MNTGEATISNTNFTLETGEEELKANDFRLVVTFENVIFTVPVTINVEKPKIYSLGDTVNIDDEYEINFKSLDVVTENLKYKDAEVVLGNNKLLVFSTEITPLNGQNVLIKAEGHITLFIPGGMEAEDFTFFIKTPFSKTNFTLKK